MQALREFSCYNFSFELRVGKLIYLFFLSLGVLVLALYIYDVPNGESFAS